MIVIELRKSRRTENFRGLLESIPAGFWEGLYITVSYNKKY